MKEIQPVIIWANGVSYLAKILNAYSSNVTLGISANFYYQLFALNDDNTLGIQ